MNISRRDKISVAIIIVSLATIVLTLLYRYGVFGIEVDFNKPVKELEVSEPEYLYGIRIDSLNVTTETVASGQTFSGILDGYGVGGRVIDELIRKCGGVFDLRQLREGNKYTAFTAMDSTQKLQYLVYESSISDFVTFCFKDTLAVNVQKKEIETRRRMASATIESSLWNAAVGAGMNGTVAMNLADVYQWSIDFYAIQSGDSFKVIYDELFIDGKSVGVGTIWGAVFNHGGKDYYAIRHQYTENGVEQHGYWDETGRSLRSAFLKAPLKYTRISSKFSNSRLHPVLRIRRPHHGVDYAAPLGTPVHAIANGVVTHKYYEKGGGNVLKIKHSRGYVSGYLHLSKYAKGINVGTQVKQGDLIAYVGSTGTSTGPHLDFRIWKNGTAIDPLKMTDVKGEDISSAQRPGFEETKRRILAELEGKEYTAPAVKVPAAKGIMPDIFREVKSN